MSHPPNTNANPPSLYARRSRLLFTRNSLNITLVFIGNVSYEGLLSTAVEPASTEVEQILTAGVFFM